MADEHESRIARNERDISQLDKEHNKDKDDLWSAIDEIKKALNYRLPLWATFLIAALSSACTGLIVRTFA